MNQYRAFRRYWLVGFVALAFSPLGARWLLSDDHGDFSAAQAASSIAATEPGSRVVCFGHVDMEFGVTSLYPLIAGRVTSVEAKENTPVAAGAVLLRLDDRLAKLRVKEAEADLQSSQEQLSQAQKLPEQHRLKIIQQKSAIEAVAQRLEAARLIASRKRELEKIQHLHAKEVKASEALVKELEAVEKAERGKLRELELDDPAVGERRALAEVDVRRARLEQAYRGVEECVLKAPQDGVALRVLVGAGEVLGAQAKQPAVLFCPMGKRLIRAEVEQEYASRVLVGQTASIQDDICASSTWHGKVLRISDWYTHRRSILQEPFQFNDVRTLECLIAFDSDKAPLRIGQRVRVTIGPKAGE